MTQKYFDNLPNMYYNNKLCKDIARRNRIVDDPRNSPYVFYPYEIKHQLRSDVISEYYYNDSQLDWLIYMSNEIIDPYYGWYLDDYKLEALLVEKYGSIEKSIKLIKEYRTNWAIDDSEISVSFYNNNLANEWKKYYSPVWAPYGTKILSYKRKQEDVTINTNRILDFTISANNGATAFTNNEIIDIRTTGTNTVGTGQLLYANSTTVRVQSVSGNTTANSTFTKYIIGETSSANVTVNAVTTVRENVTEDEERFWSPVSYFDYEQEINEQKKHVRLVGAEVKDLLLQDFFEKIQQDMDPVTRIVQE